VNSTNRTQGLWKAALTIAAKDLRAEWRNRQILLAMGLFGILTTMSFYYALEGQPSARRAALPAILWVTVIFAGVQGLGRSLAAEQDKGTLDGLLLAPIPRAALYFGKLISAWLFTFITAVVVSVALNIVFNVDVLSLGWGLMLVVGALGFAIIGTLLGSMAIHVNNRETTLPIIVLPIALPLIIGVVNAANALLEGLPAADWAVWLAMVASLDTVFLLLAWALFAYVVEE
jgi:heme exporter protein B